MAVALTIQDLVAAPRWPQARTLGLAGLVRGDTLGGWGDNVVARFGAQALPRVRARVPAEVAAIAPALTARDRVPVHAQLLLTEAIVDELLDGDLLALYPLILADTRAGIGRIQLAVLRTMGAGGAFRLGPRTFRKVHERGVADVAIDGRRARLSFRDNPLFAHPTWRVLQLFATRVVLDLADTPGTVDGEDGGDAAFTAIAAW